MSLATQATRFDHAQIAQYRYWYERLPYTAYDPGLAPNATEIVTIQDLAADTQGQQLAVLGQVASTPVSNVSLQAQADALNRTWPTVGWPASLAPVAARPDDGLRATQQLLLSAANATGAALTSPFQVNFSGALKPLSTADRLLRGLPLSARDHELAAKFQLRPGEGLRPLSLAEALDHAFRRAILSEDWQTYTLTAGTAAAALPAITVRAGGGEIAVLHSVAASIPSASVGNLVQLTLGRDTQTTHDTLLLDNAAGLGTPWTCWSTALQRWQPSVQAVTATDNVVIRLGWYRVRFTTLLMGLFGLIDPRTADKTTQDLLDRLEAGVLA